MRGCIGGVGQFHISTPEKKTHTHSCFSQIPATTSQPPHEIPIPLIFLHYVKYFNLYRFNDGILFKPVILLLFDNGWTRYY